MLLLSRTMLLLTFFCLLSFANNDELKINDFQPPSAKAFKLALSADVDKSYYRDILECDLRMIPYFRVWSDTTESNLSVNIFFQREESSVDFGFQPQAEIRHYLDSSPLFLHGKSNFRFLLSAYESTWDRQLYGDLEFGSGIGRLREGQYVAIACYINDILFKAGIIDSNLSKETILSIAKIISQRPLFSFQHERYAKYLYQEIEKVLNEDPVCNKTIPVFTWLKIIEIAEPSSSWISTGYHYWQRMFGSRFNIDFLAKNIREHSTDWPGVTFPIFESYDYDPSVRFKFEYELPKNLRTQISTSISYEIAFGDTFTNHNVSATFGWGYNIIDFILIQGNLSANYSYTARENFDPQRSFIISQGTEIGYYLEDFIEVNLEGGYDLIIEQMLPELDWYCQLGIEWRIF